MKIGLITDIHEHVEHLRRALDLFYQEGVDQIISIGDVFETPPKTLCMVGPANP